MEKKKSCRCVPSGGEKKDKITFRQKRKEERQIHGEDLKGGEEEVAATDRPTCLLHVIEAKREVPSFGYKPRTWGKKKDLISNRGTR